MKTFSNLLKVSATTAILCLSASQASAETSYYFGGNFAALEADYDIIDDDASLPVIYGRFGAQFNEYVSVEGRLGFGVGDDDVRYLGVDINTEIDSLLGIYARAGAPVSDKVYPYVIAGYTRGEATASVEGFSTSGSNNDISFGVGIDIGIDDVFSANIEYMNWFDSDGTEISGISFGLLRKF